MQQHSIDWELCVSLAANKVDLAEELLTNFVRHLPEARNTIKQHFLHSQGSELLEAIHKLHGACCYCGVPKLKSITYRLEKVLKADDYTHIPNLIGHLEQEVEAILSYYEINFAE